MQTNLDHIYNSDYLQSLLYYYSYLSRYLEILPLTFFSVLHIKLFSNTNSYKNIKLTEISQDKTYTTNLKAGAASKKETRRWRSSPEASRYTTTSMSFHQKKNRSIQKNKKKKLWRLWLRLQHFWAFLKVVHLSKK